MLLRSCVFEDEIKEFIPPKIVRPDNRRKDDEKPNRWHKREFLNPR
jgi:hypothetical protein